MKKNTSKSTKTVLKPKYDYGLSEWDETKIPMLLIEKIEKQVDKWRKEHEREMSHYSVNDEGSASYERRSVWAYESVLELIEDEKKLLFLRQKFSDYEYLKTVSNFDDLCNGKILFHTKIGVFSMNHRSVDFKCRDLVFVWEEEHSDSKTKKEFDKLYDKIREQEEDQDFEDPERGTSIYVCCNKWCRALNFKTFMDLSIERITDEEGNELK